MGDFRKLRAWQHADRLAALCRLAARRLPREERFDLAEQLRSAASSVPLNIAEGESRSLKDRLRYLSYARSSLDELQAIFNQVRRARYLSPAAMHKLIDIRDECARTLNGLIRFLEFKARST